MSQILIGGIRHEQIPFESFEENVAAFLDPNFKCKNPIERSHQVNEVCLKLIQQESRSQYVFSNLLHYICWVNENSLLEAPYHLNAFERWLNQHSELGYEANRHIRGIITGKYIPREEFQCLFPVGQHKVHPGAHTVTAHNPPDLDSTTASFISWLDAFACRVGSTLSIWNVPYGKPGPLISRLFELIYGEGIFPYCSRDKSVISPIAVDVLQQDRFIKAKPGSSIRDVDHNRNENHIILTDHEGFYIGDWRVADVDAVSRIQRLLNICMHMYEKDLVLTLSELFSKKNVSKEYCKETITSFLKRQVPESELEFHHFNRDERRQLDDYLRKVLNMPNGGTTSMEEFFEAMDELAGCSFTLFKDQLQKLLQDDLYDASGILEESQDTLFTILHHTFKALISSIKKLRDHLDRIDVAIQIKQKVLGNLPNYVLTSSSLNEITKQIKDYRHITAAFRSKSGKLVPVGVIHREDIELSTQGTVSFRDFCNHDEIQLDKSLEVISAVDHHKSSLSSKSAMVLNVADVQSSNIIIAEQAFKLNDRYSAHGQSKESVEEQWNELSSQEPSSKTMRLLGRLMFKKQFYQSTNNNYFIDPQRELHEYLLCLNAILDDTDLLVKCGWRDILITAELINRIKSLQLGYEIEILSIEDYPRDKKNLKKAIQDVLNNEDMVSFYGHIYEYREQLLDNIICQNGSSKHAEIFEDCKIQNRACSISQFKLFCKNQQGFQENRVEIMNSWLKHNQQIASRYHETDLYMHMLSTIPGHNDKKDSEEHRDEIWITSALAREESISRLKQFFTLFKNSPKYQNLNLKFHLEADQEHKHSSLIELLERITPQTSIPFVEAKVGEPILVMTFKKGALNSRKADITPYLPK